MSRLYVLDFIVSFYDLIVSLGSAGSERGNVFIPNSNKANVVERQRVKNTPEISEIVLIRIEILHQFL